MSKQTKNPFLIEKKKKHHLWGLFIPLFIIGCLLLPIGIVAVLFYEPAHYETGVSSALEPQKMMQSVVGGIFDGCRDEEDPSLTVSISQNQLNQLLFGVSEKINEDNPQVGQYIKQFDVQISEEDDKAYTFEVEFEAFGFIKTRVQLITSVSSNANVIAKNGKEGKGFAFQIADIKVGRMGGFQSLISGLNIDIKSIIENIPLSLIYNKDEMRITYAYSDFISDVSSMSGMGSGMFTDLLSSLFDKLKFERKSSEGVTGKISLSDFRTNSRYSNPDLVINPVDPDTEMSYLTLNAYKVENMINTGYMVGDILGDLSLDVAANVMHQYLCFGKEYVENTAENPDTPESLFIHRMFDNYTDFESIYTNDLDYEEYSEYAKETYFGEEKEDIMSQIVERAQQRGIELGGSETDDEVERLTKFVEIQNILDSDGYLPIFGDDPIVITDADIHNLLKGNRQLVGYGFPFLSQNEDYSYKYSYSMLDNVYASSIAKDITNPDSRNEFALVFGLNINECETSLVLPCYETEFNIDEENVYGCTFSVGDSLYYGDVEMPGLKSTLSSLMNGVGNVSEWFTIDKDDQGNLVSFTLKIDISDFLNNPEFSQFHEKMLSSEEPYPGITTNCDFELNIEMKDNKGTAYESEGYGRFEITMGYKRRTA